MNNIFNYINNNNLKNNLFYYNPLPLLPSLFFGGII